MKLLPPALCLTLAALFLFSTAPVQAQSGVLLKTFDIKAGKLLLDPSRPRLYATLPQDNSLAVIDTDTNTVLTTFFIGSDPVDLSISPDGTRLYVANQGSTSAAIGVVDLTSLTTLPSLPAPSNPIGIAAGLGNRLYVLAGGSGSISGIAQIDALTGASEGIFGNDNYEIYGGFIRLSPDDATLFYGSSGSSPSALESFDVSTATPGAANVANFGSTGSNGEGLTISHNGKFLVFPNGGGNNDDYTTSLIPTDNLNGILGTFNTGSYPGIAVFSADDSLLYQVQLQGGSNGQSAFEIFNTATFALVDSFLDPTPDATDGSTSAITGLAVTAPNGYLYIAESSDPYGETQKNLILVSTQRAPFLAGSVALSDGFYYLQFADGVPFGYYNFNFSPYLFHDDLGFEYPFDAVDGSSGIYLYDFESSTFFYTSPSLFPYLYDFSLQTFLYYYPDPTRPGHYNTDGIRYFYDFAIDRVISK